LPDHERAEIVRYLLGEATEEERLRIEGRYFADDGFHRRVAEIEDECAYAGDLTAPQRREFQRRLSLSAAGREKAECAAALRDVADRLNAQIPRTASASWWLRAAAAVILAVPGFQLWQLYAMRRKVVVLESRVEQARSYAPSPPAATFLLSPGLKRGADSVHDLEIPEATLAVHLQLPVTASNAANVFEAAVRNAEGADVWSSAGVRARDSGAGPIVELNVPASALPSGEYDATLAVRGADGKLRDIGDYHFEARR